MLLALLVFLAPRPAPPAEVRELVARLVRIPAGSFSMGSETGEPDEGPVHTVDLPEYWISPYEVTNAQYAAFVRATGHRAPSIGRAEFVPPDRFAAFKQIADRFAWRGGTYPPGRGDHPATLLEVEDAEAFCAWLTKVTGRAFRLPTEAEWEKAARGGLPGKTYPWGEGLNASRAHYLLDPARKAEGATRPVGNYPPNAYGVFDMAGNAWEWVADRYDPEYYRKSPPSDPSGPAAGDKRIVRGGAWVDDDPKLLACAHRHEVARRVYSYSIGFRVATRQGP
jgi:sulfatase modifying factor 1